jgi:hypothetical protein
MPYVEIAQMHTHAGRGKEALAMIAKAMGLAKQVSEIKDVLTVKYIASIQLRLEKKGLVDSIEN